MTATIIVRLPQVLAALEGRTWTSASEVAALLDVNVRSIKDKLADAARDGLLDRRREGETPLYRLNDLGRAEMAEWGTGS